MSTELCDTGDGLARVSDTGTVVWSRTLQEIFAPYKVTPDSGWNILLIGDRYVGFLGTAGISDYLGAGEVRKLDLSTLGITFALDARSGTLQWARPNTSVGCGAVEFTSAAPTLCALRGTADLAVNGFRSVANLEAALEDPDIVT